MSRRRDRILAFTLVETIVSTLIFGLTILAILNLFPGVYLCVKKSEAQLQADNLGRSILETLRAVPISQMPPGPYAGDSGPFLANQIDGITYIPSVTIYDVTDTDSAKVKGVRVEIQYQLKSTKHIVVHETYLHTLVR